MFEVIRNNNIVIMFNVIRYYYVLKREFPWRIGRECLNPKPYLPVHLEIQILYKRMIT